MKVTTLLFVGERNELVPSYNERRRIRVRHCADAHGDRKDHANARDGAVLPAGPRR